MAQRLRRRFRSGIEAVRVRSLESRSLGLAQHHLSIDRYQVSKICILFSMFIINILEREFKVALWKIGKWRSVDEQREEIGT